MIDGEDFVEGIKHILSALTVVVSSDEKSVRQQGKDLIIVGLTLLFIDTGMEKDVELINTGIQRIVNSEDIDTRIRGGVLVSNFLYSVCEKLVKDGES